ncbi:MAG TPA: DNA polymerase/3'-5' exonuclease PolX [Candidatus Limnocylindrales bacterium]|nr:DNA polymerase/3'-5' exonuclease PolX [Candidatus Limnocylindrales bacterium]
MPRDAATFDNEGIAAVLDEIGDLLELKGENVFRAVTYRAVARAIRDLREPVAALMEQGRLAEIPKMGPSVTEAITQLITTGQSKRHAELKAAVPQGLITLLGVPGVGPATARIIYENLKITTIDELEEAAKAHRLRALPKIQAKTEENILKSIASLRQRTGRSMIHHARDAAAEMIATLRAAGVERIEVAGSVRRYRETIGDIDLLVPAADAAPIMKAFTTASSVERVLAQGDTKSSVIVARGLQIDLRVVPPDSWGAAMVYFTGSKEHNVRLRGHALKKKLLLNEYGLYRVGAEKRGQEIASKTEEDVYAALEMDWIAPELREDHGEIDAALAHALPSLARVGDIQGDLHTHTDQTDGRDSLAEMAARAKAKGYAYMAVTDHSPGLGMTNGLSTDRIAVRVAEVKKLNAALAPFRVLIGTEVDIRANGSLDYPDEVLRGFDIVSASVHSAFGQARDVMTKRILDAMRNPYVTAISHPTGRLLERRDPYAVDLAAIIAAAKETGTWLEVNGGPERLDLPDVWVRKAIDAGARLVTNSDAHAVEELDWMEYAVANARRGWASSSVIANALPLEKMLAARKPRS